MRSSKWLLLLLGVLAMGAKCPVSLPPPEGGGRGGTAGHGTSGAGGGAAAGGLGGARDGGSGDLADAGAAHACASPDPQDVWTAATLPSPPASAVSATSPADAWLVTDSEVWHFDGATWSGVLVAGPNESFSGVWAGSSTDVWIAGTSVRHWDGAEWLDLVPPGAGSITRIWGRAADDVWAIDAGTLPAHVWHWNGASWTDRSPAFTQWVFAIWGISASDVWAVGAIAAPFNPQPVFLHWDGVTWSDVLEPPINASSGIVFSLSDLWGSGPQDIWALAPSGAGGGTDVWHYDGNVWQRFVNLGVPVRAITGSCADDVWAVGTNRFAHFDGTRWTLGVLADVNNAFAGVAATSPNDVWAAGWSTQTGASAVIVHRTPGDAAPACGNVRLDPGEQCDPPDLSTCDSTCQLIPKCGDGILEAGEDCDPPQAGTCSASCRFLPRCGNGVIDPGEECDPVAASFPPCDSTCHLVLCGNRVIDPGEQCDPPHSGPGSLTPWCDANCQIPTCGNGVIDPGETCDPPEGSWTPQDGGPTYCGFDCTRHDACAECHQACDTDPRGFSVCAQQLCMRGIYSPCP